MKIKRNSSGNHGIRGGLFGDTIHCPKCHDFWTEDYLPKYCPKCNIKLTDNPGNGNKIMKHLIRNARLMGAKVVLSRCPKCQFEFSGKPELWRFGCLRCHSPLELVKE